MIITIVLQEENYVATLKNFSGLSKKYLISRSRHAVIILITFLSVFELNTLQFNFLAKAYETIRSLKKT